MMPALERRAIEIRGVVQGVGFRPFVHGLATRLGLHGFVANRGGLVEVEVEGAPEALDTFERELTTSAPALARVDSLGWRRVEVRGESAFRIEASHPGLTASIHIAPDTATSEQVS